MNFNIRNKIKTLLKDNNIILKNEKINRKKDKILDKNNNLQKLIIKSTFYLPQNTTNGERIFHIINNLNNIITCKNCNKLLIFDKKRINSNNIKRAYGIFCCVNCKTTYEIQNNIFKQRAQKMKKTRKQIKENGLSSYQEGAIKAKKTKNNDIDDNGLNNYKRAAIKSTNTKKNTIDPTTGLTISKAIGQKAYIKRSKIKENGLNNYQEKARSKCFKDKRRKTNEQNGTWIPLNKLNDFKLYQYQVNKITNVQPIEKLKNYNLRGRNSYHLDHIVSIYDGFNNNVPPEIIGNIANLRFIKESLNCSKSKKSDMTIEELLKKINTN